MKILNVKNKLCLFIHDDYVVRCDDFDLVLEFNFDWVRHTPECNDCKSFYESIHKESIKEWIVQYNGDFYQLVYRDFLSSGKDNYGENYLCIKNFSFTEIKLKTRKINMTQDEISMFEEIEEYEMCKFIFDHIS